MRRVSGSHHDISVAVSDEELGFFHAITFEKCRCAAAM